jgi:Tripartite tricarboxylate transporter TctB family
VPRKASLALALAIMLLSGWGTYSALAWPWKAKLFPLVIGIPLFCLAAAEALWVIFGSAAVSKASDFKLSEDVLPELARKRTALAAGWIAGFFLAILLLGFPVAVPVFVFLYLKLQAKERWLFCAVFAAAIWGAFYGLFDMLLHLPFPPGALFEWLGLA